jgi:branched-chain amino acid transport system permease protein
VFVVVGLVAAAAMPYVLDVNRTNVLSVAVIRAIAVLSLVVLTGWAGQVSLGQWAFVGAGACLGGCLITNLGVPFWLALIITPIGVGLLTVIVGLPALRVRGLFLGVATLAFAFGFEALLNDQSIGRAIRPSLVERPTLFFFNFDDSRSMYYLSVAGFVLCLLLVKGLRRARLGRVLIGMRENESNLQSFGVPVVRMKLTAFAVSGAIAGFAGVLYAIQQRAVTPEAFPGFDSITIFITAVVGGLGSVAGPLLGSIFFTLVNNFITNAIFQTLLTNTPVLVILYLAPGGFVEIAARIRDSVLRIVAQRRQLVVPSLFADFDPEVLQRRLIPLAPPDTHSGLAALPGGAGYAIASEIYRGTGSTVEERLGAGEPATLALAAGAEK